MFFYQIDHKSSIKSKHTQRMADNFDTNGWVIEKEDFHKIKELDCNLRFCPFEDNADSVNYPKSWNKL